MLLEKRVAIEERVIIKRMALRKPRKIKKTGKERVKLLRETEKRQVVDGI
jgi:hypothetical protein